MLIGTLLLDFKSLKGGPIPTFMYEFKTGEIKKTPILDTGYKGLESGKMVAGCIA